MDVEGQKRILINKVVQVPYSSHVRLRCGGPAVVWKYTNNKLLKFRDVIETFEKEFDTSVVTIKKFGKSDRGFYTCKTEAYSMKETILITSGNTRLMHFFCNGKV